MYHNEAQYEGATNVWLTPKWVIDKLGPFDLDPCAADPRPFDIGQRVNLVERDNGLRQHWPPEMFVWMNPPYGPHVARWMAKLVEHGNGIALIFARMETRAIQPTVKKCSAVFFPDRRITFMKGEPPHDYGDCSSGAPSMFVAYGDEAVQRLRRLEDGMLFFSHPVPRKIEEQTLWAM